MKYSNPETFLRWSQSGINLRGVCAKAWEYHYPRGLLEPRQSPHFDTGKLTATILENLFTVGPTPDAAEGDTYAARAHELAHTLAYKPQPGDPTPPRNNIHRAGLAAAALARYVCESPYLVGSRITAIEREQVVRLPGEGLGNTWILSKPDIEFELRTGRDLILDYKTQSGTRAPDRYDLDLQAHVYAAVESLGRPPGWVCETAQLKVILGPIAKPLARPYAVWIDTTPGRGSAKGPILPERFAAAIAETLATVRAHTVAARSGDNPRTFHGYNNACTSCPYRGVCLADLNGDAEASAEARALFSPEAQEPIDPEALAELF